MMDVKLMDGRMANRRSKAVDLPRALGMIRQAEDAWPGCAATVVPDGTEYRVYYFREDVTGTLRKDAAAGQEWEVLVSGKVQVVRISDVYVQPASAFCKRARRRFSGLNKRTVKRVSGDCARLRRRVQ